MISAGELTKDLQDVLEKHSADDTDLELSMRLIVRPNAVCAPYKKGDVVPIVAVINITVDSIKQ